MSLPSVRPLVCLITSGIATDEKFEDAKARILDLISAAVTYRLPLVQLREKRLSARNLFELAAAAVDVARGSSTQILVNERADIALGAGADGVHLPSTGLPAAIVRERFPPPFMVGVSTHTFEEIEAARDAGADFALYGPIFSTPGKGAPRGTDELEDVCRQTRPFPVIAVGGIDETNFRAVLSSGASGFAAIRSFGSPDAIAHFSDKIGPGRAAEG